MPGVRWGGRLSGHRIATWKTNEQTGSTVASSAYQTRRFVQIEVKDGNITGIFSGTSPTQAYRAVGKTWNG